MLNTKRLFFSAMFLLSLALVLGSFVGCGSENPVASDNDLAPAVAGLSEDGGEDDDAIEHEFEGTATASKTMTKMKKTMKKMAAKMMMTMSMSLMAKRKEIIRSPYRG